MVRLALILSMLLALLLGAFAWSSGGSENRADFTFINRGETGTLDPNRMSWMHDIRIGYALWEGLYALDPKTLEAIPGAADRVELSDDKRVYTFHLRADGRWSNGDAVKAGDFAFAWRRMLEEPGDYTSLFHDIVGAEAYQDAFAAGKPVDFKTVGIEVLDDRTLRVRLMHPVAYFPDLCAFAPFWPLHEPSMRPFYDSKTHRYDKGFTRPPNLVSNGPFRLKLWSFKRKLRLEANEFYWDRANVKLRTVDMYSADDPMWAFLKYETGAVDWLADATGPIGAELFAKGREDLHTSVAFGSYFYSVNCQPTLANGQPNPLADARVRRALSMAIDRSVIVNAVTRMGEPVAANYIPPGVFAGYQSLAGVTLDVQKARELLAAAGYPGGQGFPRISILFNSEFHHSDVAQVIRRQWLENLGIDVELKGVEIKVFRQRLHSKDYQIARASWFGDYNDPSTFADKYRSTSENNDSGWQNREYDRLLDEAAVEADEKRRLRLFERAEGILLDEQPIIPLYHYVNAGLYRPNVKGLQMNPRNTVLLKGISVDEKP